MGNDTDKMEMGCNSFSGNRKLDDFVIRMIP